MCCIDTLNVFLFKKNFNNIFLHSYMFLINFKFIALHNFFLKASCDFVQNFMF